MGPLVGLHAATVLTLDVIISDGSSGLDDLGQVVTGDIVDDVVLVLRGPLEIGACLLYTSDAADDMPYV